MFIKITSVISSHVTEGFVNMNQTVLNRSRSFSFAEL